MKFLLTAIASCLCFIGTAPPAVAQQPRSDTPIRIDTDLVTINVTVTDKAGNYVRDLRAEDFQVYENGRLRKIDFFRLTDESTMSRPLAVVFALDLSGSLKPDETGTLRRAAMKFTELMKGDSVFAAMSFNQDVKVVQDFTPDAQKIERAFAKMNRFGGSTRIYDAIDRAVTMLSRRAPAMHKGREVRRVVIVITDGFDSASVIDRRELIRRANSAGVSVYSITLPSYVLTPTHSGERVITPLDASRIVTATGGRDFSADAGDFTPVFKALAEEIRASYTLAYYPEVRDGKYRELRVTTSRAGVRLRASRTGYTAPAN
ncbi:MAG TPA: VWA domain-containing protein [Blastocatellia bacterium]|nr:VWA domain-containing protein [Blastocatellia bacterium]